MLPGDDWARTVDRMMLEQRRIEELAWGALGYNSTLEHILLQQQRFEELTARNAMAMVDPMALTTQRLAAEEVMRGVSLETLRPSLPEILGADPMALTTQRLAAEEVMRGVGLETLQPSLSEILGARPFDAVLSGLAGLRDDHRALIQQVMTGHLAGVSDLERTLGRMMPEPAYLAWSEHLRTAALPTLSFLTQEWTTPFGLMLKGPSALGASIAWKIHRDEPSVRVAAVTPQAETEDSTRVSLETQVVCWLCDGPMQMLDNVTLTWIGPRRGVLKRPIFPACETCFHEENIPALLTALRKLTGPAAPTLEIIRGGGQGDGLRKGDLRLVRRVPAKPDPDTA